MAEAPLSFGPQDIAMGHAAQALITRLIDHLVEKEIIAQKDADKIVFECVSIQETGGPLNQVAAEILKQVGTPSAPGSKRTN